MRRAVPSRFEPSSWRQAIADGSVTFLVGAGISAAPPACLPLAPDLIERLVSPLLLSLRLPNHVSRSVLRALAGLRPEVVADILIEHLGVWALHPLLSILRGQPNSWHSFLAACLEQGCCVVTTNFDSLIEEACRAQAIRYVPADATGCIYRIDNHTPASLLFKVHGSIGDPPAADALSRLALGIRQVGRGLSKRQLDLLRRLVLDRPVIVLGYSGRDDFDIMPALLGMPRTASGLWVIHDSAVPVVQPLTLGARRRSVTQPALQCAAAWSPLLQILHGDTISMIRLLRPHSHFGKSGHGRSTCESSRGTDLGDSAGSLRAPNLSLSALAVLYALIECRAFRLGSAVFDHLDLGTDKPTPSIARLFIAESVVLEKDGSDLRRAERVAATASRIADQVDSAFVKALSFDQSGVIARRRGHYSQALRSYGAALRVARKRSCPRWLVMQIRAHRAVALDRMRMHRAALREHRAVCAYERRVGDLRGAAKSLNNIGIVHISLRQWDRAMKALEESCTLKGRLGDSRGIAQSLHNLGNVHYNRRDFPKAEQAFRESLRLRQAAARDRHGVAQSLVALSYVACKMKRFAEASVFAARALEAHKTYGDSKGVAEARNLLRYLAARIERRSAGH